MVIAPRRGERCLRTYRFGTGQDPEARAQNRMNADRPLTNTAWADREITFSHREIRTDNTTGVAGVTRRENGTYRVRLGSKRLGTFKTFEAAAAARKQAEQDVTAGHEIACSRPISR